VQEVTRSATPPDPVYTPVAVTSFKAAASSIFSIFFYLLLRNRNFLEFLSVEHRGRRGGAAGADGGPSAVSVFEAFQDEALLVGG